MPAITAVVGSASGLHARPAAAVVGAAAAAGIPITIAKEGGAAVNAASMLSLLTLGAAQHDTVVLSTPEEADLPALEALKSLIESDLDAAAG